MHKTVQTLLVIGVLVLGFALRADAQARLTIVNQSERQMTVKVMQNAGTEDVLYGRLSIGPRASGTITFSQTGEYFTKTMATLYGADPLYQKGESFRVYVGRDGYSVLTLTFTIIEAAVPQMTDGKQISKDEFDKDVSRK